MRKDNTKVKERAAYQENIQMNLCCIFLQITFPEKITEYVWNKNTCFLSLSVVLKHSNYITVYVSEMVDPSW